MLRRILSAMLAGLFAAGVVAQTVDAPPKKKSKSKSSVKAPDKAAEDKSKDEPASADDPGPQAVQEIFACASAGLPKEWRRAWIVVSEISVEGKERTYEGRFFYSLDPEGAKPLALKTCGAEEVARGVYRLNDFLDPDQHNWKSATLTFSSEGKFDLKYDYAK